MKLLFVLLVVYQLKHFICDFPLQGKYMLQKFLPGRAYILPLLAHTLVHAYSTFLIGLITTGSIARASGLALVDLCIHFVMDRIKASPDLLGKFKALTAKDHMSSTDEQKKHNTYFWWSLGVDQGVHHLTHYYLIWEMVR